MHEHDIIMTSLLIRNFILREFNTIEGTNGIDLLVGKSFSLY